MATASSHPASGPQWQIVMKPLARCGIETPSSRIASHHGAIAADQYSTLSALSQRLRVFDFFGLVVFGNVRLLDVPFRVAFVMVVSPVEGDGWFPHPPIRCPSDDAADRGCRTR